MAREIISNKEILALEGKIYYNGAQCYILLKIKECGDDFNCTFMHTETLENIFASYDKNWFKMFYNNFIL